MDDINQIPFNFDPRSGMIVGVMVGFLVFASSIVKGMLEHSRSGNFDQELTNINNLADEYLRLSYHGLRAKDSSFNASFRSELDPEIPEIKVLSQDIGRVLLNLINNAFYAVSTKYKRGLANYTAILHYKTNWGGNRAGSKYKL